MVWSPCLRLQDRAGAVSVLLGHPLLDDYLEFVAARSRTNTLLTTAYDLKVFVAVVAKAPAEVTTAHGLTASASCRHSAISRRWPLLVDRLGGAPGGAL
jgi:hypothetical protein